MKSRRNVMLGLMSGIYGATAFVPAKAASVSVSTEDAISSINAFLGALHTGDPAKVEELLAPSFQIMRSDGSTFDKVGYLKVLPKSNALSSFSGVRITDHGDTFVASYTVTSDQTIKGKPVEAISLRLSVFQKIEDRWLIVAHANFAKIG